jgi:hypothetical protein
MIDNDKGVMTYNQGGGDYKKTAWKQVRTTALQITYSITPRDTRSTINVPTDSASIHAIEYEIQLIADMT